MNNKLIAEFLGWTLDNQELNSYRKKTGTKFIYKKFDFENDWNDLIEAVEKIEHIDSIDVNILTNGTRIYEWRTGGEVIVDNSADISFEHKIEHVYDAVVKFINWYNK